MTDACYTILRKPKSFETTNEITLKRRIEGDDVDKCQSSIEELLQVLLDGEKFPSNLMMPIINRYQMNRFSASDGGQDKRIKKLLYILWECLPKRGPDGKFLDKMVMVCGAFDKDLKHPNQYVCGCALRTIGKTREQEVIRELVHSIEKCLEWPHSYQRKNAVLVIAEIYKNFPDLNQTAPKLIAEYLLKENDDECKKAALLALLDIAPEEAKPFLHSSNTSDIHCMNTSIQLLYVELIQKLYKRGSEDCASYLEILMSLIKHSSSPSVKYQAATALMRFSREPEAVRAAATCFIDICAKDNDNNVKLIALNSLMDLRRVSGAERFLKSSLMDIIFIIQSSTDLELNEKILKLSLDLLGPLNVSGIVVAIRQELKKMLDKNVPSSHTDTVKYRRMLVETVHQVAERFPNAIVELEMLDTLFDLLTCNTVGDRTSSRLILLLRVFMSNNPNHRGVVVKKVQQCFNFVSTLNEITTQRGLIQLLGDFSETKEQIESSYRVINESINEKYFLNNKFDTAYVLCYALLKMACRYQKIATSTTEKNKMCVRFMAILVSILNLGHTLSDEEGNPIRIANDHAENITLCLTNLQQLMDHPNSETSKLIERTVTDDLRSQLGKIAEDSEGSNPFFGKPKKPETKFDDAIKMSLFASRDDDMGLDDFHRDNSNQQGVQIPNMFCEIPLTGTIDPIYAYCEFDFNQYDIDLKIHLENRTKTKTFENVTIELTARGDGTSSFIDRPESIVLAPRAKACISTNVKVVSADIRRMFGSIAFDDVSSGDKEQVIMLNDLYINKTDYIMPSSIRFDDFRDIWRDCEWENKVTVKTRLTNLKEYLMHLVNATNMRCVTSDKGLSGDCSYLCANLYAKSSFGEEALVNVSVEKESPTAAVTGNVKIRSRSQGMALSLGEKITLAQNSALTRA